MNNLGTFLTSTSIGVKSKNNKKNGKGNKIIGIIFLLVGIMVMLVCSIMHISWSLKKDNYVQVYAQSNNGSLEYKYNDQLRKVDKISDYYDETLFLDIPDSKSVKLFCQKDNNSNCIYFNESNELENSIVNSPILAILCSLLLIVIGLFFYEKSQPFNPNRKRSYSMYCFCLWIALSGICILGWQIMNYSNFNKLKEQNNIITAHVYSEIYIKNASNESHKILATYIVDNKEYVYARNFYKKGNIESNIKLYYDGSNPSKALEDQKTINIGLVLLSLVFIIISIPYLFLSSSIKSKIKK